MQPLRHLIGHIFSGLSKHLLRDEPPQDNPTQEAKPTKTKAKARTAPKESPPAEKKPYDPREHKTFYAVGVGVLKAMFANSRYLEGVKVKDIEMAMDGMASETSIRRICNELVTEGILVKTGFPAIYTIPITGLDAARARLAQLQEKLGLPTEEAQFNASFPVPATPPPAVEPGDIITDVTVTGSEGVNPNAN